MAELTSSIDRQLDIGPYAKPLSRMKKTPTGETVTEEVKLEYKCMEELKAGMNENVVISGRVVGVGARL